MTVTQIRQAIVGHALWGVANEGQIHYAETRPIPNVPVRHLPITTDCSGFATIIAKWAGAPDPNGHHFELVHEEGGVGFAGFTGDMLNHLMHVPREDTQPGDLVVFVGVAPLQDHPEHVVILTESGREHADPLVVSHGREAGPEKCPLSAVKGAHAVQPIRYLRLIPEIPKKLPAEPGAWNEQHLLHIWHQVHSDPHTPDAVKAEVANWKHYFFELGLWATAHELNAHHAHELHFASNTLKAI
jgi:hypothetical protein